MTPTLLQLHGLDTPLDVEIKLRAGNQWTAIFQPARGYLRRVELGGKEVVRVAYLHVRDRNWDTPMPVVTMTKTEVGTDTFALEWTAVVRTETIDFEWQGRLTGDASGIEYKCDGVAKRSFETNRTGLCVLHPMTLSGEEITLTHANGSDELTIFPARIAPKEPFMSVKEMSYAGVHLTFSGDFFDTEDQRNWTDSSYKSYPECGYLPKPYTLAAGAAVNHSVRIQAVGDGEPIPFPTLIAAPRLANAAIAPMPLIGIRLDDDHADVGTLAVDILRVETNGDAAVSKHRVDHARAAHKPIWQAIHRPAPGIRSGTEPERDVLIGFGMKSADGLGSHPYLGLDSFTTLNMGSPSTEGYVGVEFGGMPQVHTFDERSMLENAATLEENVRTAASDTGGKEVAVRLSINERAPDPRLHSLFGAVWALESVAAAARGGAAMITVCGIGDLADGPLKYLLRTLAGQDDFDAWTGYDPRDMVVLGLRSALSSDRRSRLLIGNLQPHPQAFQVPASPGGIAPSATHSGGWHRLTFAGWEPMAHPHPGEGLTLGPYEIVSRLD